MDQRAMNQDVFELLKAGIVTDNRSVMLEMIGGNQIRITEEDGSTGILTIRGPMTLEMIEGGARSMAAKGTSDWRPSSHHHGTQDISDADVQDIGTIFANQDGDDG